MYNQILILAILLAGLFSPACKETVQKSNVINILTDDQGWGGREHLDMDETTLAEVFKAAGYKAATYGKWHNGDDFNGFCPGRCGNYFSSTLEHNGQMVSGNGFVIDDNMDQGLAFMEKNRDNPFFLYLAFNTSHTPFQASQKNWEKFRDKKIVMLEQSGKGNLDENRADTG